MLTNQSIDEQGSLPRMLTTRKAKIQSASIFGLWAAFAVWTFYPLHAAQAADIGMSDEIVVPAAEIDERRYGDFRDKLADWKVTVGGAGIYMPEYEGSDKFEFQPFPIFSAQFGERLFIDTRGVRFDVIQYNGLRLGVTGGYELGRKEDDSDYLRRMGDIDAGGVVGGIVSYEYGPFEVFGRLDKTIGGSEGMTGTFGAKASHRYERFIFSAEASGIWADDKHMEAYFGVNSIQAINASLPQYEAKAGIKRADIKASITYMLTDNWLVTGTGGVGFLMGDAKDSPLVKDNIQPFGMLGVAYRF